MPAAVWLVAAKSPSGGPTGTIPTIGPAYQPIHATNGLLILASNLDTWALIAAIGGIIVGAVIWAFGQFSQNYQQAVNGRKGVLVSAIAALLIGAAPHVVQFLFHQGGLFSPSVG